MAQKIKFILIGLGLALVGLLLALFAALGAKQSMQRERDELSQKNTSLNESLNNNLQELQGWKTKNNEFRVQLQQLINEKADLTKKYDLAEKARAGLLEEMKSYKSQKEQLAQLQQQLQQQQQQKVITAVEPSSSGLQADDVYWARILKAKTDIEFQLESVRSELKTMQINNEQLLREKTVLELDIINLKRDNQDQKRKFDYTQKLMDSISQELVREKNDKARIQESFAEFKSENSVLRRQLASLNNRKIGLERKLQEQQEQNTTLQDKAENVRAEAKASQDAPGPEGQNAAPQAIRDGSSVELPAIVVRPSRRMTPADAAPFAIEAKVMAINRDNNFVIIDQGEEAGVKVGDSFKVDRGGKVIASLEVIQVRKAIAACDIKKESAAIKVGDKVI